MITIRRGGSLTGADHHLLALWAASCAEHVLALFESAQPGDPRPRQAIEHARAWVRGEVKVRSDFEHGELPLRHVNPALAVLLTMVQEHAQIVRGPDPVELLHPVPAADLRRSLHDGLAPLVNDLVGDERNVLLTLARMVVALSTGEILSKDQAVRRIAPSLREPDRSVLNLAAGGYRGELKDDWSTRHEQAIATATRLADQIRATSTE